MYSIELVKSAIKELNNLDKKSQEKVSDKIDELEMNPRPIKVKKLKGHNNLYRVRSGDYRIVYKIDDEKKEILITRIRHRKDVYE